MYVCVCVCGSRIADPDPTRTNASCCRCCCSFSLGGLATDSAHHARWPYDIWPRRRADLKGATMRKVSQPLVHFKKSKVWEFSPGFVGSCNCLLQLGANLLFSRRAVLLEPELAQATNTLLARTIADGSQLARWLRSPSPSIAETGLDRPVRLARGSRSSGRRCSCSLLHRA